MTESERLLTIDEAARYLNVSKTSLRRWTNSGQLPCHRVGVRGERRFSVGELQAFLASSGAAVPETRLARPAVADSPMALLASTDCVRHLCSYYSTTEEWWRMFRPFAVYHGERLAPIVYLNDTTTPERFGKFMRREGFDPLDLGARGLLEFVPADEAYLPGGSFSIERMLAFVESAILKQRSRGRETMLIAGEMTWSLRGAPGTDGMIAYEQRLTDMLQRYPGVTVNCQYDLKRLSARTALDALCVHPFVHAPQGLFPGFSRNFSIDAM